MKWILKTVQILDVADSVTRDQIIEDLVQQRVLRGPSEMFELEQVVEYTPEAAAQTKLNDESLVDETL